MNIIEYCKQKRNKQRAKWPSENDHTKMFLALMRSSSMQ